MFGRGAGHTYGTDCTVSVYVNGEHVVKLGPTRGSNDYAFQMGQEWLMENGYLPGLERHANGSYESLWQYIERTGCTVVQEFADVGRMMDL
jgi:hypothetical protein